VSAALRAGPAAALVPVPSALAAGCEGTVLRQSVAVLWRSRPGGMALVAAAYLALPLALAVRATATGSAAAVAMTAVVLAWTARLAVAATWTRGTRGDGAALAAALAAPLRDAAALLVLGVGAASARIEAGGTRFRIRRGGVLVPTADGRGAADEDF
jgi:hypothetical protein